MSTTARCPMAFVKRRNKTISVTPVRRTPSLLASLCSVGGGTRVRRSADRGRQFARRMCARWATDRSGATLGLSVGAAGHAPHVGRDAFDGHLPHERPANIETADHAGGSGFLYLNSRIEQDLAREAEESDGGDEHLHTSSERCWLSRIRQITLREKHTGGEPQQRPGWR